VAVEYCHQNYEYPHVTDVATRGDELVGLEDEQNGQDRQGYELVLWVRAESAESIASDIREFAQDFGKLLWVRVRVRV